MRILSINGIKKLIGITVAAGTVAVAAPAVKTSAKSPITQDVFQTSVTVPPSGTTENAVLINSPSPVVFVEGEKRTAAIVVDLSRNILYKYDENGDAQIAYRVASGKKSSPTDTGLRVVTHVEKYPYKSAPPSTKRYKNPRDYGPRIICLETLNPRTGERGKTGEFIHGNKNPNSIGKYASLGCIRMDNTVIKELSQQVKRGDLVLITK